MTPVLPEGVALSITPVGSQVTCNPPPTDTDRDWLVLLDREKWTAFFEAMDADKWEFGGSEIDDAVNYVPQDERFVAFRLGDDNIIATDSPVFHKRFLAATSIAKHLNLLVKDDRIALFQAVLYGNPLNPTT